LLYKHLLIVPATAESEALVGLDKLTGEEIWRQEASGFNSTWGSPVLARVGDESFDLVIAVPQEIWGLDPETGKLNWYCEAVPVDSICSSVVADDKGVVYAIESSRGGGGGAAVKAAGKQPKDQRDVTGTHVLWSGRQANRIGTPIIYQGRLYAVNNKTVHCLDAATGDEVFTARLRSGARASDEQDRGGGGGRGRRGGFGGTDYGSPVLASGKIYFTSRGGETFVLTAGDAFEQLAVNRVTTDVEDFSATPAVSDGALYIRSDKHLYCVSAN
jgi:outer membrane protein assembly factor BamB